MTEELEQLLKNLHQRKILEIADEEIERANQAQISYQELLLRLFRAQWHAKQEKTLEWRIKNAKIPERWALETFPFKKQPGVHRRQIKTLAELDFIPKAENLVFIGPTGVGKTGLASALLLRAIQNGYRGRFIRAQDLFDEMYASLADRSTRKLLNHLAKIDLLVVDLCGVPGYVESTPENPKSKRNRRVSTPHNSAMATPSQRLEPVEDRGIRPP